MPEHTDRDVDAARERDPAPAVTRALRILGLLAESAGVPQSLSDIARALGIAKSSTANLCQVLEDGAIVGMGTHDELSASNETYREIVESQLGVDA